MKFRKCKSLTIATLLPLIGGAASYAEINSRLWPDDPGTFHQRSQHDQMNSTAAWSTTQGSRDVIVAVVDTGINASVEDFRGRIVPGYDAVNMTANLLTDGSTISHGTRVASAIAAAGFDGVGGAGMDWNCRLMPVKVTIGPTRDVDPEAVARGIDWAVEHGANVINLSFGLTFDSGNSTDVRIVNAIRTSITNAISKGVIVLTTASPSGATGALTFPGTMNEVIAVGGINRASTGLTSDSSPGSTVDIVAPAEVVGVTDGSGDVIVASGVSYSTAFASGVAALMLAVDPSLKQADVERILRSTAQDVNGQSGFTQTFGHGILDAGAALQNVLNSRSAGLKAEFFSFNGPLLSIPDLVDRVPGLVRIDENINYNSARGFWSGLNLNFLDTFASRHTGYIRVEEEGWYTFYLTSDDGSKLWINGSKPSEKSNDELINNDGQHGSRERSGSVYLHPGYHPIRVEFFDNALDAELKLSWSGPGFNKQIVPSRNLSVTPPPNAYNPGLWYGTASGGQINLSARNPQSWITTGLVETEDAIADYTTEIYTGEIYHSGGNISFREYIDDEVHLVIGGNTVLDDRNRGDYLAWNNPTQATISLSRGWHKFELRIANGNNGNGPVGDSLGFMYDPRGGTNWIHPEDPGDGSLFRVSNGRAGLFYSEIPSPENGIDKVGVTSEGYMTTDLSETEDTIRNYTTEVLSGQYFNPGGLKTTFRESVDDAVYLNVDRISPSSQQITFLDDSLWYNSSQATVSPVDMGWWKLDLRMYNGNGGSGPTPYPNFTHTLPNDMGGTTTYLRTSYENGISWRFGDTGNFTHPEDPGDGSVLRVNTISPGLWYGHVSGNINTVSPNPKFLITRNLRQTEDQINDHTTEIFTGQIYDADGSLSIREHVDDKVRIYIDGELVLSNDAYGDDSDTGDLGRTRGLTGGWHEIEIRISNGDWGSGPSPHDSFGLLGISFDPNGGVAWRHLEDPGDGSLLRTAGPLGSNSLGSVPSQVSPVSGTADVGAGGRQAFLEYAQGNFAPSVVVHGEVVVFSHQARNDDSSLRYIIETSETLDGDWNAIAVTPSSRPSTQNEYNLFEYEIPQTEGKAFYRLHVIQR